MMADLAGVVTEADDQIHGEEWVQIGEALPLRTAAVDLRVTETPDGGIIFEVTGRDGHVLEEPTVVIGDEGLSIRVGTR
jgi:hypothetical protein